ncbi:MAG: type II toxin-antitoxin system VapC family toxin [Actinobacteria bacterium]|nr:type II toxin-antitoxin system VapC family toxin [Actinomycetota bacterium]
MIYLDSGAVVKLAHAEPETAALRAWLGERAEVGWVSSALVEIESFRAVARYAPAAVGRLPAVLDQIDLIELTARVRRLAQAVEPVTVRSLDAIHLASALARRADLTSFLTYDRGLLEAARAADLPVAAPA